MADDRPTRRAEQTSETAKASDTKASEQDGEQDATPVARNPKDLGTDVDKLPPVPGAGQFMPADQATEEVAPAVEQKKG